MYLLEGSCDPIGPLTGGPPGIPGSPRPTEPNVLPVDELITDVGPALAWPGTVAFGTACGGWLG